MPFIIEAELERYENILNLRQLFLQNLNAQFRYEACHERNWSDYYRLMIDGQRVGYGAVKGMEQLKARDSIFEFYLLPSYRQHARHFFSKLAHTAAAGYVECQSNDELLTVMAYAFSHNLRPELWLLEDDHLTHHHLPGAQFRKRRTDERVPWETEDPGDYILLLGEKIVAEGGYLLHYNPPFADIHMSVAPSYQGKGIGTFFVQELKHACYLSGRMPAARCQLGNLASRDTLQKAGMRVCGQMLWGNINPSGIEP